MTNNTRSKFGRVVEIATNISIILVAVIGATVLIKNYLLRPPSTIEIKAAGFQGSQNTPPQAAKSAIPRSGPAEGAQVPLTGINWSESDESVVLALSNKCHFCTESAPFYQRLSSEMAQRKNVRIIAVFPQDVGDAKKYLSGLGVPIEDVRRASLDSIGVRGTPTLIIVDSNGKVKQSWVGRLSAERESEVLSRIKT